MTELTPRQRFLLEWLGKEDTSAYGECRGKDLDALVEAGLAKIRKGDPRGEDYNRVALTEAGWAKLKEGAGL